jgi:hypothetical protein
MPEIQLFGVAQVKMGAGAASKKSDFMRMKSSFPESKVPSA